MRVEVLYIDDCPHRGQAVEQVRQALREEGIAADIFEIEVRDHAMAEALEFRGSPTVRVDGLDVEAWLGPAPSSSLCCRTYRDGGKGAGSPSLDSIRRALAARVARSGEGT